MSTMMTFQAGRIARLAVLATLCACSSEQQDWRSAEGADTSEAWGRFIEQHPDSELAAQARARIAQLGEQRDWQHASAIATAQGYRQFLAHHPSGSHAEEARIRIESFGLGSMPRIAPQTPEEVAAGGPSGVNALQAATIAAPPSHQSTAQPATSPQGPRRKTCRGRALQTVRRRSPLRLRHRPRATVERRRRTTQCNSAPLAARRVPV